MATNEEAGLQKAFWKAIAICLVGIVGLGVLIHQLNAGHHRPEGTAERWLNAVSDTGRGGVRQDAVDRVEEIGPLALAKPLLPADPKEDHGLFPDLEVGKAVEADGVTRVPFHLHQSARTGDEPVADGALLLRRVGEEWRVVGVDPQRRPGEEVPSEGGAPPSSAGPGLWALALVIGLGLAIGASVLVRWAGRPVREPLITTQ